MPEGNPRRPVTLAFSRHIRSGCEPEFEAWTTDIAAAASRWPGYLGTTMMRPAYEIAEPGQSHAFTSVYRFASEAEWQAWAASPERRALLVRADAISDATPETEYLDGLDYWFHLPGASARSAPPKWKMALVITILVYAMLQVNRPIFMPLGDYLPLPPVQLLSVATSVTVITWILLPAANRLLRGWLFSGSPRP